MHHLEPREAHASSTTDFASASASDVALLPNVLIGVGGSAGAASALIKLLPTVIELQKLAKVAIIVQLHSAQQVSTMQPNWLLR
jgi:hypothetical protein